MRFYDPLRGVIQIGQTPLTNINTSNMRHMFAYVTQETVLFHDSIENNIKIAKLDATSDEIQAACQKPVCMIGLCPYLRVIRHLSVNWGHHYQEEKDKEFHLQEHFLARQNVFYWMNQQVI